MSGGCAERLKVGACGGIIGPQLDARVKAKRLDDLDDGLGTGQTSRIGQVR